MLGPNASIQSHRDKFKKDRLGGIGTAPDMKKQRAKTESSGFQLALDVIVGNCGPESRKLILAHRSYFSPKIRYLAGTSPEYQRHVLQRLASGDCRPLRHTAESVFVYDTVSFKEILSRLYRGEGCLRMDVAYLNALVECEAAGVDRLPDRLLTLRLIKQGATDLAMAIKELPVIQNLRSQRSENVPRPSQVMGVKKCFRSPTTLAFLGKNLRNLPMLKPQHFPTANQQCRAIALCQEMTLLAAIALRTASMNWGHAENDLAFRSGSRPTQRIITHSEPDCDAILGTWLVERYLFASQTVEILFLPRGRVLGAVRKGDCLVDVGNALDPARSFFDHKPPALPSRHDSCAAKLVWEELLRQGQQVQYLKPLVLAVFAGDSVKQRSRYALEYERSKLFGLHAKLDLGKKSGLTNASLYRKLRRWLDSESKRLLKVVK